MQICHFPLLQLLCGISMLRFFFPHSFPSQINPTLLIRGEGDSIPFFLLQCCRACSFADD